MEETQDADSPLIDYFKEALDSLLFEASDLFPSFLFELERAELNRDIVFRDFSGERLISCYV